jgi:hypothetical protein
MTIFLRLALSSSHNSNPLRLNRTPPCPRPKPRPRSLPSPRSRMRTLPSPQLRLSRSSMMSWSSGRPHKVLTTNSFTSRERMSLAELRPRRTTLGENGQEQLYHDNSVTNLTLRSPHTPLSPLPLPRRSLFTNCKSFGLDASEFCDNRFLTTAIFGKDGAVATAGWTGVVKHWKHDAKTQTFKCDKEWKGGHEDR